MSQDEDPLETREWLEAPESVIEYEGVATVSRPNRIRG